MSLDHLLTQVGWGGVGWGGTPGTSGLCLEPQARDSLCASVTW